MENPITPPAVRRQLAAILAGEGFARAPRMQRFLTYVVEEALAGRAGQISEYAIGLAVFDRAQDFEPGLDPIVRNEARRLRLKLLEHYQRPEAGGIAIDIPKGGYAPVFSPIVRPASNAMLRIAVQPFECLMGDAGFAKVLGVSLSARLTEVTGLPSAAHDYVQPGLSLSHVVRGCTWECGGRLHAVVNLVRVSDGAQLWAREYACTGAAIAEIGADAARAVAARLAPAAAAA